MAAANFLQTSFLGGEIAPFMQGRMDLTSYRISLNVARNVIVLEEGAAPRRSGTRLLAATRSGAAATLREFHFSAADPYMMEFSAGHLRFFRNRGLIVEQVNAVRSISTANPAEIGTGTAHGWTTGDQVEFHLASGVSDESAATLFQRQFSITTTGLSSFTIVDSVTGVAVDGSTISLGTLPLMVGRVVDYSTVYAAAQCPSIKTVQDQDLVLLLHAGVKPYNVKYLTTETATGTPATFSYGAADFIDGPYQDAFKDGSTVTPSALTGTIGLTASIGAGTELPAFPGFVSTDIGRMVRLFSEPAAWSSGTAYAVGDNVKFADVYWSALKANTGKQPDLDVVNWTVSTTGAAWTWGKITGVTSSTVCEVALQPAATGEENVAGGDLLSTNVITTWRMGLYSDTTGWPTCGTYDEGRVWLSGAQRNRFDGARSNRGLDFAPTGRDGTVADNSAISYVLNAASINDILWMEPDDQGIIMGTQEGEWLVRASAVNDPLTPTSIQAKKVTKYGCFDASPVRAGISLIFINRYGRKVVEYTAMPQPGKFSGFNLSLSGKHLTAAGVEEIVYQQEIAPLLWARMADGSLAACTYRRDDPYGSQPVAFAAWHRHDLGHSRTVTSLQAGPSPNGTLDSVMVVTYDAVTGYHWVETLVDLFDQDTPITEAFFLDGAMVPGMAKVSGSNLILYGLMNLAGKTCTVSAGGLDMGDFTVSATGTVTIPVDAAGSLFTSAYLATLTATGSTFANLGLTVNHVAAGTGFAPNTAAIDDYAPSGGTVTAVSSSDPAADWWGTSNLFYHQGTTTGGLRSYNLATTGQVTTKTYTELGVSFVLGPMILGRDGFLYFPSEGTNSTILQKVTSGLVVSAHFGVSSGTFTTGTGLAYPYDMASLISGDLPGHHYIVSSPLNYGPASKEIAIIDTAGMTVAHVFASAYDEERMELCTGASSSYQNTLYGEVYGLAHQGVDGAVSTPLGLYRIGSIKAPAATTPTFAVTKIGTISPAQIDATWTTTTTVRGLGYDETDGNLLFFADNGTTIYLVKVSAQTAAVIWKVAVNGAGGLLNKSRIRNGRYDFLSPVQVGGTYHLYQINTTTGVDLSTTEITGMGTSGQQLSDGGTGAMVMFGTFTSAAGSPTGSNFTSHYSTFAAGGSPAGETTYSSPFVVGYTYTSQGQIVRPVSPQETGAQLGPALGKTRRSHQFVTLVHRAQGVSFGTEFTNMRPAVFAQPNGTAYTALELYSGVHEGTLEDDSSFDSLLCWEVSRPYPTTVLAIGPFLHTQDR